MATKKKSNESEAPTKKSSPKEAVEVATAAPPQNEIQQVEAPAVTPVENNFDNGGKAPVLTQQIVTAKFRRELALINYQSSLQKFIDWNVTQDNIPESQKKMKEARGMVTSLKNIKATCKKPALDECEWWENSFKEFLEPLESALTDKDKKMQDIAKKEAAENLRKQQEKDRVDRINKEIDNFILDQSKKIAEATKTEQLVTVEKFIGSHKGNASRYQEFLPSLIERCNELTPLIKTQKNLIKELEDLEKQTIEATKSEDDRKLLELQERHEQIVDSIEEKKIQVQETAIYQATRPDEVTTPEPVMTAIKPRRRSWSFDIVDEKRAFAAGMLICELNKEAVKIKLEHIKTTMGDKKEVVVDGIKYSYVETY